MAGRLGDAPAVDVAVDAEEKLMPIDVTDKAKNLCSRLMAAATKVMEGTEELANLKDEKESAGLDLTDEEVEAALAASDLKHAEGADFNNVISSGAALKTWLEGAFHDDVFQKVRG